MATAKEVAVLSGSDEVTEVTALEWPSAIEEEHRRQVRAWLHNLKVWPKVDQAIAETAKEV
eukprot:CAMPEP_0117484642 /NCGR_PEP_ID=MMETSP0784-20121206/14560_1 /TAXON_ID=39447 /ORGANISM="" /LENGTH=60 /DNA_ID=CAMNT_0005279215 /DNA_START=915 /DNA_END=1096 /DNA_ORIENTATION=-